MGEQVVDPWTVCQEPSRVVFIMLYEISSNIEYAYNSTQLKRGARWPSQCILSNGIFKSSVYKTQTSPLSILHQTYIQNKYVDKMFTRQTTSHYSSSITLARFRMEKWPPVPPIATLLSWQPAQPTSRFPQSDPPVLLIEFMPQEGLLDHSLHIAVRRLDNPSARTVPDAHSVSRVGDIDSSTIGGDAELEHRVDDRARPDAEFE
ncbi:hypothetical protein A0H81_14487 [Grifola frondosa]|uniref:Uncharacterized protein n=1 Tax=Grifola frondosa TaxID=5627 RepID=A0A1C7LNI6_GRIFR|nr:hypothetical protein A0H81_14487 [Grifola frondosa]